MIPANLKSAFSLFNVQNLLNTDPSKQQQQQTSQQPGPLLLHPQQHQHLQQQLQKQQQQQQTLQLHQFQQLQQQTGLLAAAASAQQLGASKPIDLETFNQNLFYQAVFAGKDLENYLDAVLRRKNTLEQLQDYFVGLAAPNFIKLVGNITLASLSRAMEQSDARIIQELIDNPMKIILRENVWRLVTQIISKRLFEFHERVEENYYKELSQMLIFKPEVADIVFAIFSDKQSSNSITLGDLSNFHSMLQSSLDSSETQGAQSVNNGKSIQRSTEIYANLSFSHYGGSQNIIQRNTFVEQLETAILMLSQYFEKQNTIVGFIKRSSKSKLNFKEDQLLQSYLKVMGDFKQTNLKNFLSSLAADVFDKAELLDKMTFTSRVAAVHAKTSTRVLFTLFELIQIELDLVHQDEFVQFFLKNQNFNVEAQQLQATISVPSSESQNYYLKTIDKLLNKCVFNGDEKCDCKKCQCIRRNRNSAKESQKKKREALQQIGPLLEKQEVLEKRLQELESENAILRKLLTEMVTKGSNNSNVQEIIQPISKIIAYQLKEEDDEGDNQQQEFDHIEGPKPRKRFCGNTNSDKNLSSQTLEGFEFVDPLDVQTNQLKSETTKPVISDN